MCPDCIPSVADPNARETRKAERCVSDKLHFFPVSLLTDTSPQVKVYDTDYQKKSRGAEGEKIRNKIEWETRDESIGKKIDRKLTNGKR